MQASLERPDSLRPFELFLPIDSQTPLCGKGLGGKPVSPAPCTLCRSSVIDDTDAARPTGRGEAGPGKGAMAAVRHFPVDGVLRGRIGSQTWRSPEGRSRPGAAPASSRTRP